MESYRSYAKIIRTIAVIHSQRNTRECLRSFSLCSKEMDIKTLWPYNSGMCMIKFFMGAVVVDGVRGSSEKH